PWRGHRHRDGQRTEDRHEPGGREAYRACDGSAHLVDVVTYMIKDRWRSGIEGRRTTAFSWRRRTCVVHDADFFGGRRAGSARGTCRPSDRPVACNRGKGCTVHAHDHGRWSLSNKGGADRPGRPGIHVVWHAVRLKPL